MSTNYLLAELQHGGIALGGFMQIGHPAVAEVFARAGLGWIILDCEHGVIDLECGTNLMRAMAAYPCHSLVRLPRNDSVWIARFLDAGARGVVVPMVNTVEQAQAAVDAAKYPPTGRRGFGFGRANAYGADFDEYAAHANQDLAVIIQIEHEQGVKNIDGILAVEGIDGVFVGPYDLSGSMNILGQMDHPEMLEALDQITRACDEHDVPAGLHIVQPELHRVQKAMEKGFRMLALSLDAVLLYTAMHELLTKARDLAKRL